MNNNLLTDIADSQSPEHAYSPPALPANWSVLDFEEIDILLPAITISNDEREQRLNDILVPKTSRAQKAIFERKNVFDEYKKPSIEIKYV